MDPVHDISNNLKDVLEKFESIRLFFETDAKLKKIEPFLNGLREKEDDDIQFGELYKANLDTMKIFKSILQMMKWKASSFQEWDRVCSLCMDINDENGRKEAIENMQRLAETKNQWAELCRKSWKDHGMIFYEALEKWDKLDVDKENWLEIIRYR